MSRWGNWPHRSEVEADERYAATREIRAVTSETIIKANADRITGIRQGINEGKRMSKLAAISERLVEKKIAHDKKADEWAMRLDALDQREPAAFAIGDAVIEEKEGDLAEMEKNMRTISNLPLAGSVK